MGRLGMPIAARVRSGPRFAEIDVPIVHVPGATPPNKEPAKKSVKRAELVPTILPDPLQPDPEGLALYIEYVTEREAVRLRKEAGQPWPWTDNQAIRDRRFCNNERRRDRTTIEIMRLVVEPYRDHSDVVFLDIVARLHNEPEALIELLAADCLAPFDPDRYLQVLEAREARGAKNYRTDAYRALLVPNNLKGMKAPAYHARIALPEIYARREYLRPRRDDTLKSFTDRLRECPGIDSFFAGQIAADLKSISPLCDAPDYQTFALPGPGSEEGFNWVFGREPKASWREWYWCLEMDRLCARLAPIFKERGLSPLDGQDTQSTFCEYNKYRKALKGEGRKRLYRLAQPEAKPRKPAAAKTGKARPSKPATVPPEVVEDQTPITAPVPIDPPPAFILEGLAPDPMEINNHDALPEAITAEQQDQPHCLAAALAYAARGWTVFPVPRGTKKSHKKAEHSNGRRWGATADPDEIRRDFAKWPQANIGIPTGAENGIWVLEADTKEGHAKLAQDSIASLHALEAQYGPLPETLQVKSPSGSLHFYFNWPAGKVITNSASSPKLGAGIDVRGEGGMVLAPPSIKPSVGAYTWITDAAIADAPGWLIDLAIAAGPSTAGSNGKGDHEPNPDLEAALPLVKAAVAAIPNDNLDWENWNTRGMAIFAATGGSNAGFVLFDEFSQKSAKYDKRKTFEKWRLFHTSPPDRIGFGSLQHWASEANPDWLRDAAEQNKADDPGVGAEQSKADDPGAATAAEAAELGEWDAGDLLSGAAPEPRQWLIARYFCRSFLSGLVAPGDAGKTTLRLTQAIELATGRELLGLKVYQRCRVLVVSFEDDRAELHRRLLAICKHHGIAPAELTGWLYCRDLNGGAKLAELDARGRRRQIGALDGMVRRAIVRTQCALLVLDPFVKLHALNESDNPDMDYVCSLLIKIAQDFNIAVDSPAHTHKGTIQAGDADARRGASAQRDAGRLDYTLTVMSEDEAKQFGIAADERKSYMRLDKAKANIVRAIKATWFRLVSVRLDNASALYPEGDEVQAIEQWQPPETWAGAEPETLNAILDAIAAGLPDGRRYSDHSKAKGREAWQVVQKQCPGKPEAQCREMIRQWLKAGVLVEKDYDDPTARKERKGLFVDPGKRPHY